MREAYKIAAQKWAQLDTRSVQILCDQIAQLCQAVADSELAEQSKAHEAEVAALKADIEMLYKQVQELSTPELAASQSTPAEGLTDEEIAYAILIDGVSFATPLREIAFLQARAIIFAHEAKKEKSHTNEIAALQSKIDALMLEFCPDEMTPKQYDKWGKSQKVSELNPAKGLTDEEIKDAYASKKVKAKTHLWEPDVLLGMRAVIDAHEFKKAKPVQMLHCRFYRNKNTREILVDQYLLDLEKPFNLGKFEWISDIVTTPATD